MLTSGDLVVIVYVPMTPQPHVLVAVVVVEPVGGTETHPTGDKAQGEKHQSA